VRKSANDEVTRKKDDIFDQYLEEPDWSELSIRTVRVYGRWLADGPSDQQPRKQMSDQVEKFLDLAATEEDHGDVRLLIKRRLVHS
jgi:transcription initiation factor TFIIH subunit 1